MARESKVVAVTDAGVADLIASMQQVHARLDLSHCVVLEGTDRQGGEITVVNSSVGASFYVNH